MFRDLPDPRATTVNFRHALIDILTIAVCAIIGRANTWEQIAEYGRRKEPFFRRFLTLGNGIPSHDTFYRVFTRLRPAAFADRFAAWMAAACQGTGLTPIAIDGKSTRRAKRVDAATGCLHVVSAWATANRLTLRQVAVPNGTNETGVIPDLLATPDLAGAIVTIDAAGYQAANARLIRGGGGHYLLAVKGTQPTLEAAVHAGFADADAAGFEGTRFDHHTTTEAGHGRHEERSVSVIYDPKGLPPEWVDAAAVVSELRERTAGGATTTTAHYYLSSHAGSAAAMAGYVRGHWGIESMHWVLDVAFREDESRTSDLNAGANLAMLRRVVVSLLKRVTAKGSIETRRLMAAWDDDFLLKVLQGIPAVSSA
ncbi:MAG TPA: ISAs1 family transposase [Urbifossiella sp.]|nr:ISAs1 family transposase [Urbifossiella sp.]